MRHAAALSFVVVLTAGLQAQRPMPSHHVGSPPKATDVARVNGVALTSDRLAAALAALIPQESFHRNVSPAKMAELRTRALDAIIDEELAYQEGVRLGLTATSTERQAAWKQTVTRYGGPARFDEALRQAGVTKDAVGLEIERRLVLEHSLKVAVTDQCRVTTTEARDFFSTHPERFVEPEQLHVHAITIGVDPSSGADVWKRARERAETARVALAAGTPFADVARAQSTDTTGRAGGDMGFVHRGSLAPPFEEIVRALPVGTPSGVVESIYGYHIVLVSEIRPSAPRSFDQVQSRLVGDLTAQRCADRQQAWLAGLRASAHIERIEQAP